MSLCDEKGCFATRRVTSSREALFKTFEKCDFVTISVALRREGLLRNEKCDFVTRSVVTSLDPSVGYADSSRGLFKPLFSTDFVRHFSRHVPAALLKCFVSFRRLCRHFSQASPALLAGSACSSRRTSSVTSRGFIPPHFSNVYSLLAGSPGSFLQQSYFALNYYFK